MESGVSVLVVDDEPMVRDAMRLLLRHAHHQVKTVDSAVAALELLAREKFDLVITDFSMPEMPGDQLVARIRQFLPNQPIIMATAFVDEYRVFGDPASSVDALLLKPFSFKELVETIDGVLTRDRSFQPSAPQLVGEFQPTGPQPDPGH